MTPLQQFGLLLLPVAVFYLWMQIFRPEQYERERQRRNDNIKSAANFTEKAAVAIFKLFKR